MSNKPKCPVFGCTIPRGIPHEHPADVSVVMRDPVAPLNALERDELNAYRRMHRIESHAEEQQRLEQQHRAYLHAQAHQNAWGLFGYGQNTQANAEEQRARNMRDMALLQIAAFAPPPPITIERQLTDAITYGLGISQDGKHIPARDVYVVPADAKIHGGRKLRDALLMAGHKPGDTLTFEEVKPAPRRSFLRTIGRVAFWIVVAVTVAIWIFAGVKS